jgi:hypothetical protein
MIFLLMIHRIELALGLLFTILGFSACFGQSKQGDSLTVREFNFYYRDTIEGKVVYGDYEPTSCVLLDNGSLIVSTQFSINSPGNYKRHHVSSGTIFRLNSKFEKQWEIFFKEHRVMKVGKLPDQSIIVAGDRTDMKKFWMARIDTSGKMIWQKEYNVKASSTVSNMVVDNFGNSFTLVETERRVLISFNNYRGKRKIVLFTETEMENNIYLVKVSSNGKALWKRSLDKTRLYEKFGYQSFLLYHESGYTSTLRECLRLSDSHGYS